MSGNLAEVRHFVEEARHVLTYEFNADEETIEPAAMLRALHALSCALEEIGTATEPESTDRPPVESADDPELTDEQIDKLVVKLAARVKSNGGKSEISEMVGALASKARPA